MFQLWVQVVCLMAAAAPVAAAAAPAAAAAAPAADQFNSPNDYSII